jgi:hypothetical protein
MSDTLTHATDNDGTKWTTITPAPCAVSNDAETVERLEREALSLELRMIEGLENGSVLLEDRDAIRARLARGDEIRRELDVIKISRRARRERRATLGERAAAIERLRERVALLEAELPTAIALDARTDIQHPITPRAAARRASIERLSSEIERLQAGGAVVGRPL